MCLQLNATAAVDAHAFTDCCLNLTHWWQILVHLRQHQAAISLLTFPLFAKTIWAASFVLVRHLQANLCSIACFVIVNVQLSASLPLLLLISKALEGELVPIPTLPLLSMRMRSVGVAVDHLYQKLACPLPTTRRGLNLRTTDCGVIT